MTNLQSIKIPYLWLLSNIYKKKSKQSFLLIYPIFRNVASEYCDTYPIFERGFEKLKESN